MSAALPLNAACPRCGGTFRCGAADLHCACFHLQISPALRMQLAADFSACLCVTCLAELHTEQKQKQEP